MSTDLLDANIKNMFEKAGVSVDIEDVQTADKSIDESPVEDKDAKIKELSDKVAELESELAVRETCLRCGRELGTSPLTVTDAVAEEYFRHLLGQIPFEKTFKLFGGQLLVTFKELSGSSIIENSKRISSGISDSEFSDTVEMALLVGMLKRVSTYNTRTMETKDIYIKTDEELVNNTKNPKEAYNKLLESVGQVKIAVIRRACTTFELLLTALIEKSQDENFYEDAGLL